MLDGAAFEIYFLREGGALPAARRERGKDGRHQLGEADRGGDGGLRREPRLRRGHKQLCSKGEL